MIINVGHPENSPRLEQVLTATMGAAFPHVTRDPVTDTNTLLMGSNGRAVGGAAAGRGGADAAGAAQDRADDAGRLGPR